MIVKIHETYGRIVVAVCDSGLIGKKFEDNKLQLDLTSDFYMGKEMSEKEVVIFLRKANIINIVGQKSVDLAVKEGMINKDNIIKICSIPHAQAVIMD